MQTIWSNSILKHVSFEMSQCRKEMYKWHFHCLYRLNGFQLNAKMLIKMWHGKWWGEKKMVWVNFWILRFSIYLCHAGISRKSVGSLPRNGKGAIKWLTTAATSGNAMWNGFLRYWVVFVMQHTMIALWGVLWCECVMEIPAPQECFRRWFVQTSIHMTAIIKSFAAEVGESFGAF